MVDTSTTATGSTVDTTKAPAKILSVIEIKNGHVYVITEAKVYQLLDGKLAPMIFADVEAEAVAAKSKPATVGAVPAAPPPPAPVMIIGPGPVVTPTSGTPAAPKGISGV